MKKLYSIYIIIVFLALALPAVLIPFYKSGWKSETTSLSAAPGVVDEQGRLNMNLLSDAGAWFEDHFAYRPELITAGAKLQNSVFSTSASQKIITGKNGWLYFNGTIKDYQRTEPLSDRALQNIVHNLKIMQDYYELLGIRMLFFTAPDKCTLYPENLPYYIQKGEGKSDAERLYEKLEEAKVNCVDLTVPFENSEETLYYAADTHWNNKGAALAFDEIMGKLGEAARTDYGSTDYTMDEKHRGDLAEMLYPSDPGFEEDAVYDTEKAWTYEGEVKTPMDVLIKTSAPGLDGSVFMFRDSFGSALIPYFAGQYGQAVFSRLTPYKVSDPFVYGADTVIVERAERNISVLASEAPIMVNPVSSVEAKDIKETETTCEIIENGGFYVIRGIIDPDFLDDSCDIYVSITDNITDEKQTYEAFYLSVGENDGGYQVNLLMNTEDTGSKTVEVLAGSGEEIYRVRETVLDPTATYEQMTFTQGEE